MFIKYDLMIINRGFWPTYPIIGEALLNLAENVAKNKKVCVVFQDRANIRKKLFYLQRGENVKFFPLISLSNSSSYIITRLLDNIFFLFWVLGCLILCRPKKIYVSTDPPIFIPFFVFLYSKIFKSEYFYHLQDIHPEATNVVFPINKLIFKFLIWIDSFAIKNAKKIITLNSIMKQEIKKRSNIKSKFHIIKNPHAPLKKTPSNKKRRGFTFCGNAGRLQRIPLLINSIKDYHSQGGKMKFIFAGGGIYSKNLKELAVLNNLVNYLGTLSAEEAAHLTQKYDWALLPIEDEVTKFAFPSKTSTYIASNAKILAICGYDSYVSQWVKKNKLGITSLPIHDDLVSIFHSIENKNISENNLDMKRIKIKKQLDPNLFVKKLERVIFF